ncbi:hypothetical protein TVAG_106810 [Trichomonas vaginalis G3]|uniref:Peptidyl-prolyl cis-trans isomerase n=1 Tax=Trichomonas vaginalis (strain ATCC PRA-98 / G3) TaxID=412133 RepID=A2E6H3_TRIV3|nr:peptidyl-prolyl cis-trans isomerase protein [Trichomonas vaginalis G3]EAY11786.1 hypothetical protein TVAG_106810 [Trichomonas vaginalis G3]KAI5540655.1 peptidyl-prolyl cis-trans isomerase protein [Trichomonas vaginalis G3]|eukprot:XP_001324009.1 hypothetical protein [Trichomonas vaginalis G3]
MSIAFITSRGTFVVDLFLKTAPMQGFNMLKLAKINYFNNSLVLEIMKDFYLRIGNLQNPGGTTVYQLLTNNNTMYIRDEINNKLSHSTAGFISTSNSAKDQNTSEFFITLGRDLSRFDSIRTIFGRISENFELIKSISEEFVDETYRPYKNIRILGTKILYDPFEDPPGFEALKTRFVPYGVVKETNRLEYDEILEDIDPEKSLEKIEKLKTQHNAEILEMLGDIPDADARPPDTTLFICKLHPRTTEDGLRIVFSKFGTVTRVDLLKDKKTGQSLCYGFIEFSKAVEAENAYKKMQRAVIDNRIVLVDFCQSLRGPQSKK